MLFSDFSFQNGLWNEHHTIHFPLDNEEQVIKISLIKMQQSGAVEKIKLSSRYLLIKTTFYLKINTFF